MPTRGKNWTWYGDEVFKEAEDDMKDNVKRAAHIVRNSIIRAMKATPKDTSKRSRRQGRGKGRIFHHPSFAGQAPAVDMGRLWNSITPNWNGSPFGRALVRGKHSKPTDGMGRPPKKRHEVTAVVGTNVKYGYWLEVGTERMKARPYLRAALAELKSKLKRTMKG